MENEQPPPIYVSAVNPDHPNPASIVFLHGYDDDAESYTGSYPFLSWENDIQSLNCLFLSFLKSAYIFMSHRQVLLA